MDYRIDLLYDGDVKKSIAVPLDEIKLIYNVTIGGKSLTITREGEEEVLHELLVNSEIPVSAKLYKGNEVHKAFEGIFNFYYRAEVENAVKESLHFDIK